MQFVFYTTLLLSLATSSLAYFINTPNGNQGWRGPRGPGHIAWSRVDTDPEGFAVILTNQDRNVLPRDIVLRDWVNGNDGRADILPPRGGFPIGDHFRVNFVKTARDPNTIYAQSNEFSIRP